MRLHGFWATTTRDNYTLFMDREEFEGYGLDTTLPSDFKFFEVQAAPGGRDVRVRVYGAHKRDEHRESSRCRRRTLRKRLRYRPG